VEGFAGYAGCELRADAQKAWCEESWWWILYRVKISWWGRDGVGEDEIDGGEGLWNAKSASGMGMNRLHTLSRLDSELLIMLTVKFVPERKDWSEVGS